MIDTNLYYNLNQTAYALGIKKYWLKNRCLCGKTYGLNPVLYEDEFLFKKEEIYRYIIDVSQYLGISESESLPLKSKLKELCYIQNDLSYILGIHKGTLSQWKNNKKVIFPKSLKFLHSNFFLKTKIDRFIIKIRDEHKNNIENYMSKTPDGYLSSRDIRDLFNCSRQIITIWMRKYKEFKEPIKIGQYLYWEKDKILKFYQYYKKPIGYCHLRNNNETTVEEEITNQYLRKSLLNQRKLKT